MFKDITGQKFNRLIVLSYSHCSKRKAFFLCKCDCGNKKIVCGTALKSGNTKSCGCLKREVAKRQHNRAIHGLCKSKVYLAWIRIKTRCMNKNIPYYKNYGGRGITVCERWLEFKNFLADMGHPPTEKHSIDRIDNNKGYSPDNCRWSTGKEQANNKRTNHYIEYGGEVKTIAQWANIIKINPKVLRTRIYAHGWPVEKAFTEPVVRHRSPSKTENLTLYPPSFK